MNTLTRLEKWNGGHKARAVEISIDNGYGASCWAIKLNHEHGTTTASEVMFTQPKGMSYRQAVELAERQGHVVADKGDDESDDWPGLEVTISAAIDGFEKGVWKKKVAFHKKGD